MYIVEIENNDNVCNVVFPKNLMEGFEELKITYKLGDTFTVNGVKINVPKYLQRIITAADIHIKTLDRGMGIDDIYVNGFKCVSGRHIVKFLKLEMSDQEYVQEYETYKEILDMILEDREEDVIKFGLLHDLLQCGGINVKG